MQIENHPAGRMFLSAPNNHDRFFFLPTFRSPAFDFNVGVAMNESCCFTLTSAILKVEVVCDVNFNVFAAKLHDLLYNQCIDNTCCYSFLYVPKVG